MSGGFCATCYRGARGFGWESIAELTPRRFEFCDFDCLGKFVDHYKRRAAFGVDYAVAQKDAGRQFGVVMAERELLDVGGGVTASQVQPACNAFIAAYADSIRAQLGLPPGPPILIPQEERASMSGFRLALQYLQEINQPNLMKLSAEQQQSFLNNMVTGYFAEWAEIGREAPF